MDTALFILIHCSIYYFLAEHSM